LLPVTLEPSREVKFEQHDMNLPGGNPGHADQFVDIDRTWTQCSNDQFPLGLVDVGQGRRRGAFVAGGKPDRRGRRET